MVTIEGRILVLMERGRSWTIEELSEQLGSSPRSVRSILSMLKRRGKVAVHVELGGDCRRRIYVGANVNK